MKAPEPAPVEAEEAAEEEKPKRTRRTGWPGKDPQNSLKSGPKSPAGNGVAGAAMAAAKGLLAWATICPISSR